MIDRKQAKAKGVKVVVRDETLADRTAATIAQLKQLLPNVINSDNQLDAQALKDVLSIANTTSNNQGYELTFAGKGIARAKADSPTNLELKTELKQSKNFNDTDNVVIRGDNIEVLKILYQNYHNKIKMIYIDPPYNTQSENFVYNDNFKQSEEELIKHFGLNEDTSDFLHNVYGTRSHSGWLSFMYPRLKLARDLLTDDGVIFISIDDNEQANLKIICDEIFGDDNFVANLIWQKKTGASDAISIATITEYILVYIKNSNAIESAFQKNKKSYDIKRFNLEDSHIEERGRYYIDNLDRGGLQYSDSLNFAITCPDGSETYPNGRKSYINDGWIWKWSKKKVNWALENDFIEFRKTNKKESGWSVCYKNYLNVDNEGNKMSRAAPNKNLIANIMNANAANDMKMLFEEAVFKYPKPVDLLKQIINYSKLSNTDIILDFFAGSGTIGDAVMRLNAEDGGARKFILVQLDETIDKKKSAEVHKFCTDNNFEPVVSSITIERLNRAGEKIKEEYIAKNGDLLLPTPPPPPPDFGYKVFSITDKPQVSEEEDVKKGEELFSVTNQRASVWDTLYNMLAATCKPLHTPIETLKKDVLYQADNELYLLANIEHEKLSEYADKKINLDGWAKINLEQFLNLDVPNKENITVIY